MRRLLFALVLITACAESADDAATDVGTVQDIFFFDFDFGPPPDLQLGTDGDDAFVPDEVAVDDTEEEDTSDVCVPTCGTLEAPLVCGPDGCGGSCGTCEEGTVCADGGCATIGGTCNSPIVLEASSGSTTTRVVPSTDQSYCVSAADGVSYGSGAVDVALQVQSLAGAALVKVVGESTALLQPSTGCGSAATCLGPGAKAVVIVQGTSFVSLEAEVSEPVDLVVALCATTCGANSCLPDECGLPCTCAAGLACRGDGSCAPSQPGETCNNALPVVLTGSIATQVVSLGQRARDDNCTPAGHVDAVYALQTATDERVRISVSSTEDVRARLSTSCFSDKGTSCGAPAATPGKPVGVALGAAEPAWLVIEGPPDATAEVTLTRCEGCDPECPCFQGQACVSGTCVAPKTHDRCDDPLVLETGAPAAHSLAQMSDDYRCFDGESGSDAVVSFTAPKAGEYGLRFDSLHPLSAYELTRCGDPSSCAQRVITPTEVVLELAEGQTTTWVVDRPVVSLDSGFTALVTDCAAACVGAPCDQQVCGRTCGCAGALACVEGACAAGEVADACDTAPTLSTVPTAYTVDLNTLNADYSCRGRGAASPDAVVRFVAPRAGTFVAKVTGLGGPVVYRPSGCGTGISICQGRDEAPVVSQEFFFARDGQEVLLVLDRLAPEGLTDGTVSLVISSVTGVAGGLGAACASSADCPLAERCLLGVCSLGCTSSEQCGKGVAGPRGATFGCPSDVCFPSPAGCSPYCVPGAGGALACNDDASCGGSDRCTGFGLDQTLDLVSFCTTSGTLAPRGAPCTDHEACASNLCVAGACREPCASSAACSPTERCLGTVGNTVLGGKQGIVGVCRGAKDLGATCVTDANCPGGSCDAVLGPAGETLFVCRAPPTSAQFAFNEICAEDGNCTTGRCLFGEVLGLLDAYCSSGCTSDADCAGGTTCRDYTVWDSGTPSDPADDITLPVCVRGGAGAGCLSAGVNTCDPGLLCKATVAKPAYGTCSSP